ncbi:hypothetical protein [Arthrobacter sp. D2-10]
MAEHSPEAADHSPKERDREDTQRRLLNAAVSHSRLDISELWLYYFSIGGSAGEYEVEAYLNASFSLPAIERDLLAHAVNELIDMIPPPPRAPYSSDLDNEEPASDARDKTYSDHPDDDARR